VSPEETEVARQLCALRGWKWAPGMVGITHAGARWVVYHIDEAGTPMAVRMDDPRVRPAVSTIAVGTLPDLADPATAGALLGMLTDVDPHIRVSREVAPVAGEQWFIATHGGARIFADSLGLAVARALVAVGTAQPLP